MKPVPVLDEDFDVIHPRDLKPYQQPRKGA